MGDKEELIELADAFGFEFKEGIDLFLQSPSLLSIMQNKGMEPIFPSFMVDNPMIRKMIAAVFTGAATGIYRGFECYLMRGSKSSSASDHPIHSFVIVMMAKTPLDIGLDIYARTPFTWLGNLLMGSKYAKIADSELARVVAVRGRDMPSAQAFIDNPANAQAILTLFKYSKRFKIGDFGIRYEHRTPVIDAAIAKEILDKMAEAGTRILQ